MALSLRQQDEKRTRPDRPHPPSGRSGTAEEAARQFAALAATGGEAERNVDPQVRIALGDLSGIADMLRALSRLALDRGGPRDLDAVRAGLHGAQDIAIRLRRGGDGALTEEISVDPARAARQCLGEAELAALDGLATQCDDVYGARDHDIEFAFRGGEMFLLQRRPITRA